jgi:hypothetical protein
MGLNFTGLFRAHAERSYRMDLTTLAAWLMTSAFAISIAHETYRSSVKAGVSQYDSMHNFLTRTLPFYGVAMIVVLATGIGVPNMAWPALAISIAIVLVSILYYNPIILRARQPGVIDWTESIVFVGLFFASGVLLAAHVSGITLAA